MHLVFSQVLLPPSFITVDPPDVRSSGRNVRKAGSHLDLQVSRIRRRTILHSASIDHLPACKFPVLIWTEAARDFGETHYCSEQQVLIFYDHPLCRSRSVFWSSLLFRANAQFYWMLLAVAALKVNKSILNSLPP